MTYIFTLHLSLKNDHCIVGSPNVDQFQKSVSLDEVRLISGLDATRIGQELFRTFFDKELLTAFEQADVKRLVISSDNNLLLRLNWEYLHDDSNFVLPHRGITLLRVRRNRIISPSLQLESPPLRILLTTSGIVDPNIPKDIEIVRGLGKTHPLLIQVTVEKNIASTRLAYRFAEANQRNEPYHIWHHYGVVSDDKIQNFEFSDKSLSFQDLNTILASSPLTKIALLHLTRGDPVAAALALDIPVVIGLRQFISPQSIEQWLKKFYSEILVQPIDGASILAQTDVYKYQRSIHDWAIPLIITNTNEFRLFEQRQIAPLLFQKEHIYPSKYPMPPQVNRILFLAANPMNTKTLRINREMAILDEKIRLSVHRTRFELVKYGAVRYFDLSDHLLNNESQIVHFSVHGSEGGNLLFEDEKDKKHPVTPESLGLLLEEFSSTLRLVIFNACWSYEHAQAICQSVDCVVGMGLAISDIAALNFTRGFYEALFSGRSVASAFKLGCAAIGIASRPGEVDTPQLLTKDGVDASTIRFI